MMDTDQEISIDRKLDQILDSTYSLDRTVRGSEREGNRGLIGRLDNHEERLINVERNVLTLRAKVGGAAAFGGAVGAIGALLGFLGFGGGG